MNYRGGGHILLLALTKWVTGGGGGCAEFFIEFSFEKVSTKTENR